MTTSGTIRAARMLKVRPHSVRSAHIVFLMTVAMLFAAPAEALEGRIVDRQTGKPIAGAEVGIAGLAGTVHTGQDGRFVWAPDPPLPFTVIVIIPGGRLARPVRVLTLPETTPLLVQIDPALDENVVISGTAPSVEALPGTATTLIPAADIARRASASLMQALENVPGVGGVAEGQSAVPAIRGLARGRTLLLLDGSRLFSERRAGPSVSFLSPDNLDRIDVVRGSASVAYGSDAFGGVISMITRQPSAAAPIDARLSATLGAGVPAERFQAQSAFGLGARGGLVVEAHHRRAKDYSSPDGVVPNSAWQDQGALVRGGVKAGGWWTAGWQGDSVKDSGLPRSDSATLRVSTPYERSSRASASFDRAGVPVVGHVNVTGLFGRYSQRLDQDRLAAPGRPRRIDRADIDGTDLDLRATARGALGGVRLTAGGDVTNRRGLHAHDITIAFNAAGALTSAMDNLSIASADKRDAGLFAKIDLPLASRMTMSAGARFDRARSVNTGGYFGDRSISHRALSGSASLAYRPWSAVTIAAQLSRGFRDPTLSDRFFRGPVGRGFIVGNPDLGPERSVQFDLTARYDGTRWRVSAAYYHYDISDLIERYQSGTDTFLFRNRGLAEIRGMEVEGGIEFSRGLAVEISGHIGRGRAADNGAALDDIGPARAILQLRQRLGERTQVSMRVSAIAANRLPGPSEVAAPSYIDAGITVSRRAGRWLDLHWAAANLLNQRYYSSSSSRRVLAAGRYSTLTIVAKY
jgi:outer membrane receptor protein involved in Fe transport